MTSEERTARERAAQGLPPKVEDPAVLARVAALVVNGDAADHPEGKDAA